jgi:hypothetical protein
MRVKALLVKESNYSIEYQEGKLAGSVKMCICITNLDK